MSSSKGNDNADHQSESPLSVPRKAIEFVAQGEKPPRGVPRYRDPANPFNTWVGRGKRPQWLRNYLMNGRTLDEFLISHPKE